MTIPYAFIDELRARTTLSSIITRGGTALKKAGREWKACCPFHQEKTPSFTVNDEKGFYHCFGCGAHGDAIRWLTDQQGMTFIDAVKMLAEEAGLEVPAPDPQTAARERRRSADVETMARAQKWFAGWLHDERDLGGPAALLYLSNRGIRPLAIERFGIGFAPASGIAAAIREDGQTDEDLARLGLIRVNPDTGEVRDFFRRRIMIPIHDARGSVIAFGGRIVGSGEPKYLNSPDTPIFDKGRTLFNLHRVSAAARAKNQLLIVEGYMDVIGVDSVGFDTAVAPNGTALTEAQLHLAWRLVDVPVVCFDGDTAGRRAAVRAAHRAIAAMPAGKSLRFAAPPEGKDPDDLAREGGLDAVNALLVDAVPLLDIIWRDLLDRFDVRNPDRRAALSAEIKRILETIRDRDVRASYGDALRTLFQTAGRRQQAMTPPRSYSAPQPVALAVHETLILGILRHPGAMPAIYEAVATIKWPQDAHRRLVDVLLDTFEADDVLTAESAAAAIEKAGLSGFVAEISDRAALRVTFLRAKPDSEEGKRLLAHALVENLT